MSLIMMNETPYGGSPSDPTKADLTSIAPAFDATATYADGDVVSYNGKVWIFTYAHTGAWDAADADETDVAELTEEMSEAEVQAVKDAFTGSLQIPFATTMDVIDLRGTERVVGKWIESDGTEKTLYEKTITMNPPTAWGFIRLHIGDNITNCHIVGGFYREISRTYTIGGESLTAHPMWSLNSCLSLSSVEFTFVDIADNGTWTYLNSNRMTVAEVEKIVIIVRYTKSTS